MPKENDSDELLRPAEVARRLGVSPVTVRSWVAKGWIISHRTPGGHRRFKWDEVKHFIDNKEDKSKSKASIKILVVDDDEQFRSFLVESISLFLPDAIIREAVDGFQVGIELANLHPDLVLLDYNLPGFDGIYVCNMIRENQKYKNTSVVAMSGYADSMTKDRLLMAGARMYLAKPISLEVLKSVLLEHNYNLGM